MAPAVLKDSNFMSQTLDDKPNSFRGGPDDHGHFGIFGGRFVAETLMPLILELEAAYESAKNDDGFQAELTYLLNHYGGRPSPLYFAERITEHCRESAQSGQGAKIYFKRDELNHTGSHKINNCLGQIQLARRMNRTRIIAETGAGQHGVAVATVAASALVKSCQLRFMFNIALLHEPVGFRPPAIGFLGPHAGRTTPFRLCEPCRHPAEQNTCDKGAKQKCKERQITGECWIFRVERIKYQRHRLTIGDSQSDDDNDRRQCQQGRQKSA